MLPVGKTSSGDDAGEVAVELAVSTLRFVDGAPSDDAAPLAAVLTPSSRVARSRQGEQLLFFFEPTNGDALDLCRGLRDVVREVYWSTVGSVTAALRRAASVANRYLFEHNLNSEPAERCYGGLSCAVIRDRDLFLLQAGPAWACVLQDDTTLRCFPRGEKLAHLGIGPVADVRLNHVLAAVGDTLLMASPALLREAGRDGLLRVLPHDELNGVMADLEQLGASTDFTALTARWEPSAPAEASDIRSARRADHPGTPSSVSEVTPEPSSEVSGRAERGPRALRKAAATRERRARKQSAVQEWTVPRKLVLKAGEGLKKGFQGMVHVLTYVWHAVAAVGAGVIALVKWLVGAIGTMIRGMLPGGAKTPYRRVHRPPPPDENPAVLAGVAIAILVFVAGVVVAAYLSLAVQSRFEGVIKQAEEQIALAQAAETDAEEARLHWEQALQHIETAATLQPDDPSAQLLREQAQDALDQLNRIQRLTLTQLADFGSSSASRRLVLGGHMLFILDPEDGWGARVALNDMQAADDTHNVSVLVRTGQMVERDEIGKLIDCAWVDRDGGRQSSALLILEADGSVVSHDPAWRSESGGPQLARVELSGPVSSKPVAVGTYRGQFYVLDVGENGGQIWRYRPQGDAYSQPPEPYFASPPTVALENAADMAIDGHIYILYRDGTVGKFLGGELQHFEVRDVPDGLGEITGIAVDPSGSGTVYLADRTNGRVIELYPDGRFKAQFQTDAGFSSLEAIAVNEAERTLYVLDGGHLYVTSLP